MERQKKVLYVSDAISNKKDGRDEQKRTGSRQQHRQQGRGDGTASRRSCSSSATAVSRKVAKTGTKSIN